MFACETAPLLARRVNGENNTHTKMNQSLSIAYQFLAHCNERGITIERCENILTLSKRIPIGDKAAFADAEMDCSIIYDLPGGCGSVWGTDGASIGGMTALNTGRFRLNRSGVQKRILKAIANLSH
jgi:hypothetical protein